MDKLGKYEILEKIGEGGFGAVFRARDPHLKRIVALKTCSHDDADLQRRFLREGEIVASLQHPNITLIHDLGFDGGTPFLVQEFLSGEDLTGVIDRRDPISEDVRIGWLVGIARGLEYAHGKGIVHRDIKPANIRILEDGTAKIMDFGIARLAQSETRLTRTGSAMGTIAYMSPEQIDGSEVDHRSDIFAFGVLAYELFAFERPFGGETTSRIVYQILHSEPRNLEGLSDRFNPGLDRILRGCLAKLPAERFQSFAEVVEAFDRLLAGLPPIDESTVHGWGGAAASRAASLSAASARPSGERSPARPLTGAGTPRPVAPSGGAPEAKRPAALRIAIGGGIALAAGIVAWLLLRDGGGSPDATAAAPPTATAARAPETPSAAPPVPVAAAAQPAETPRAVELAPARPVTVRPESVAPRPAVTVATAKDSLATSLVERAERAAQDARLAAVQAGALEQKIPAFAEAEAHLAEGSRAGAGGRTEAAYDAFTAARARFEEAERQAERVRAAAAEKARAVEEAHAAAAATPQLAAPAVAAMAAPVPSPAGDAESEIRRALDGYIAAYERLDAGAVVAVVPSLAPRRAELGRAFSQYRSLDMQLERCRIEISGESATAQCDKRQSFELKVGQGRPVESKAVFRLSMRGGRWAIDAVEGG